MTRELVTDEAVDDLISIACVAGMDVLAVIHQMAGVTHLARFVMEERLRVAQAVGCTECERLRAHVLALQEQLSSTADDKRYESEKSRADGFHDVLARLGEVLKLDLAWTNADRLVEVVERGQKYTETLFKVKELVDPDGKQHGDPVLLLVEEMVRERDELTARLDKWARSFLAMCDLVGIGPYAELAAAGMLAHTFASIEPDTISDEVIAKVRAIEQDRDTYHYRLITITKLVDPLASDEDATPSQPLIEELVRERDALKARVIELESDPHREELQSAVDKALGGVAAPTQNGSTPPPPEGDTAKTQNVRPWTAKYSPQQLQMAIRLFAEGKVPIEVAASIEVDKATANNIKVAYQRQIDETQRLIGDERNTYLASLLRQFNGRVEAAKNAEVTA